MPGPSQPGHASGPLVVQPQPPPGSMQETSTRAAEHPPPPLGSSDDGQPHAQLADDPSVTPSDDGAPPLARAVVPPQPTVAPKNSHGTSERTLMTCLLAAAAPSMNGRKYGGPMGRNCATFDAPLSVATNTIIFDAVTAVGIVPRLTPRCRLTCCPRPSALLSAPRDRCGVIPPVTDRGPGDATRDELPGALRAHGRPARCLRSREGAVIAVGLQRLPTVVVRAPAIGQSPQAAHARETVPEEQRELPHDVRDGQPRQR